MATRKRQKDDLVRQNKMYQDINRLAEEIVATKHHVIKLCEMENSNREALNALKRKENFSQKCWVNMGGMFIKMNKVLSKLFVLQLKIDFMCQTSLKML